MIWRDSIWTLPCLTVSLAISLSANLLAQSPTTNGLAGSKELQSLTHERAAGGIRFHLKGTILCYDEGWHQLYVHDGNSTTYISPQDTTNAFRPGQSVEITGTALGDNTFTNV